MKLRPLAAAGFAATLLAQPLPEADRARAIAELESSRKLLLDAVSGLTPAQWMFKPAPERWSIAECVEHIALAEDSYYRLITGPLMSSPAEPAKRAEVRGKDDEVLRKMPDRSSKRVTSQALEPKGLPPNEALEHFLSSRERFLAYARTAPEGLRDRFRAHRAVGLIDGYQWILLASGHTLRHIEQIREVKAHPAFPAAGQATPRSGFFKTTDGVRLHYLEAGQGPAIVFVPGWTMPASIWMPQIRDLARDFRVVALDPRSQGESEKPAEGHYPERRAEDVKELVEHLGIAPAVLVGWSLGVPELLTYVDRFGTGSIRALVLVDGWIGGDPDPAREAAYRKMLKQAQLDRPAFASAFVRQMYKKAQPEDYLREVTAESLKTPTNTAVCLLMNIQGSDWRPVLAKIDKPLLYAVTPWQKPQAEMLKARLPAARVELFEEAGHALFADEPERFNQVLRNFLAAGGASPR